MEQEMSAKGTIQGTAEAWESRELGDDKKHAKRVSEDTAKLIDEAIGMQPISIRLDKALIESFKILAEFHGVGYQPLMRDALKRFAEHEMKNIVHGLVESQRKKPEKQVEKPSDKASTSAHKEKKAA